MHYAIRKRAISQSLSHCIRLLFPLKMTPHKVCIMQYTLCSMHYAVSIMHYAIRSVHYICLNSFKINATFYHINFIIKKDTSHGICICFCMYPYQCIMQLHYAIYIEHHAWVKSLEIFETLYQMTFPIENNIPQAKCVFVSVCIHMSACIMQFT